MDTICRLCSTKTPALTSVFSFKNEKLIADMIAIICPIKIDPSDEYSKNICMTCLRILTEAYGLREKSVQSDLNFKTGKFKFKEVPKAVQPEITSIKVEKDPFTSSIEFVDESYFPNAEYDDESDYCDEITPVEPNFSAKKSKYESFTARDGSIKYKCPCCQKTFSHISNVKRHIQDDHDNKIPTSQSKKKVKQQPKEVTSTSCNFCGAFISHKTNLRRHVKQHHPEKYSTFVGNKSSLDSTTEILETSSELTKKFFGTDRKQQYMQYVNVIAQDDSEHCFKYQCLLCIRDTNKSKIWKQSVNNLSASNIRRHLNTMHPDDFQKYESTNEYDGYD